MTRKQRSSRLMQSLSMKESWVIFFILGIIMMNFPFLSIFNKPVEVFGVPLLYLYLYVGWLISIVVIWLFNHVSNRSTPDNGEQKDHREGTH